MTSIRVSNTLDDLASDTRKVATSVRAEMVKVVRKNTVAGNRIAKRYAKASAGDHGKLYPRSFSYELSSFSGFGGGEIVGIYGPEAGKPQGGMSFEGGSRNQSAHNDLAKSQAIAGPALAHDAGAAIQRLFWPS